MCLTDVNLSTLELHLFWDVKGFNHFLLWARDHFLMIGMVRRSESKSHGILVGEVLPFEMF